MKLIKAVWYIYYNVTIKINPCFIWLPTSHHRSKIFIIFISSKSSVIMYPPNSPGQFVTVTTQLHISYNRYVRGEVTFSKLKCTFESCHVPNGSIFKFNFSWKNTLNIPIIRIESNVYSLVRINCFFYIYFTIFYLSFVFIIYY